MPNDLAAGDIVDVWVVPSTAVDVPGKSTAGVLRTPRAISVLRSVMVVASDSLVTLGSGSTRNVVVGLRRLQLSRLATVLPRLTSGSIVLVRHGG
jgi:hypothetical protein